VEEEKDWGAGEQLSVSWQSVIRPRVFPEGDREFVATSGKNGRKASEEVALEVLLEGSRLQRRIKKLSQRTGTHW